jgi:hypothetical protein
MSAASDLVVMLSPHAEGSGRQPDATLRMQRAHSLVKVR